MAHDKWLVIINPNAGKGKGKKDAVRIRGLLSKAGFDYSVRMTDFKGHAITLTREGIEEGFRKIMIVGGDGTLNEVVNGILLNGVCPSSEITLGLIPVGTGNDWGKMFGISLNYSNAIDIIKHNRTMLHDAGLMKYHDGAEMKERYFINIAGLGFQSAVVKRSNNQKEKGRGGKMTYFYSVLRTLFSYHNTETEIIIDDERITSDVFSINIGNGRFSGGGMSQTPDAVPNDGILDVTVINDIGKLEIIRNLKLLYDGTILSHPKIDGYTCRKISIKSKVPVYADADGETLGHTPVEVTVLPSALKIIYHTKIMI